MSDAYSGSVYVQIKSPCKQTFPFPFPLSFPRLNVFYVFSLVFCCLFSVRWAEVCRLYCVVN